MSLGSHVGLGGPLDSMGRHLWLPCPQPRIPVVIRTEPVSPLPPSSADSQSRLRFGFVISQRCGESKAPDVILTNPELIFLLWGMVGIAGPPLVRKQPPLEKEQGIGESRLPPGTSKGSGVPSLGLELRCIFSPSLLILILLFLCLRRRTPSLSPTSAGLGSGNTHRI